MLRALPPVQKQQEKLSESANAKNNVLCNLRGKVQTIILFTQYVTMYHSRSMQATWSNKAKTQVKRPEPTRLLLLNCFHRKWKSRKSEIWWATGRPMLHYWRKKDTKYPQILIINLTACIINYLANIHMWNLRIKSVGLFLKCMHATGHVITWVTWILLRVFLSITEHQVVVHVTHSRMVSVDTAQGSLQSRTVTLILSSFWTAVSSPFPKMPLFLWHHRPVNIKVRKTFPQKEPTGQRFTTLTDHELRQT